MFQAPLKRAYIHSVVVLPDGMEHIVQIQLISVGDSHVIMVALVSRDQVGSAAFVLVAFRDQIVALMSMNVPRSHVRVGPPVSMVLGDILVSVRPEGMVYGVRYVSKKKKIFL